MASVRRTWRLRLVAVGLVAMLVGSVIVGVLPAKSEKVPQGPVHNLDKDTYYQTIQAAINDAEPGNRIFVSSGIYYENVVINKTLTLMGEDRNTTIIDGNGTGDVVYISADWVNVSGFGVRNGNKSGYIYSGIYLLSSSNDNITNCAVYNNFYGIHLHSSSDNNAISNCDVYNNYNDGIRLYSSSNNNITNCNVYNNSGGVSRYMISQTITQYQTALCTTIMIAASIYVLPHTTTSALTMFIAILMASILVLPQTTI